MKKFVLVVLVCFAALTVRAAGPGTSSNETIAGAYPKITVFLDNASGESWNYLLEISYGYGWSDVIFQHSGSLPQSTPVFIQNAELYLPGTYTVQLTLGNSSTGKMAFGWEYMDLSKDGELYILCLPDNKFEFSFK